MLAFPAIGSKRGPAEVIRSEGICHLALDKKRPLFLQRAGGGRQSGVIKKKEEEENNLGVKLNSITFIQGAGQRPVPL